jgi:flavin reductase (DIM6/NTAB) family NADH-FMN oxidoreductase RutF
MAYIEIDPSELKGREGYFLLTSLVVPRPIAWVSSISVDGLLNLAPHSYFNAISSDPLIVHFTSTGVKDTLRNVRATGEFVINIVDAASVEPMNLTAADFPPEESEFEWAGLEAAESSLVAPPRVAAAPAALECKVNRTVSLGNGNMVFGDVVRVHVNEDVMRDGRVAPDLLRPISRLGGSTYSDASKGLFDLKRPTWDSLKDQDKPLWTRPPESG